MKNTQKQGKESGKVQVALLVAVFLAAGGAGVWSQLHAATQASPATFGSEIDVFGQNIDGSIRLNGDGTASVSLFQATSVEVPCAPFTCYQLLSITSGSDPVNTTYTQTVNVRPGASGQQIGSGAGSATVAGTSLDFTTFSFTPVTLSFQMVVQAAGDTFSFNNHTLNVQPDPVSGKMVALREVSIGTGASGATAGSISMSVDGAPYYSETGVFGQVESFSGQSVTRLQ